MPRPEATRGTGLGCAAASVAATTTALRVPGGGRYFTGSPSDGFGCSVCHRGAPAPNVQIRGLPRDFLAGITYDVELAWDAPALAHALTLELVTGQGVAAGTIALPDDAQISARERCQGLATGAVAAQIDAAEGRQILSLRSCGASLLRFRWTAPQASEVTFAAGVVRSDASASPEGDGTAELSHALLPVGAMRSEQAAGCSAHNASSDDPPWLWALGVTLLFARRGRSNLTRAAARART